MVLNVSQNNVLGACAREIFMKKIAMLLILSLLAAFVLASCGGSTPTPTPTPVPTETPTPTEQAPVVVEIDDVAAIASGDFIVGKYVYRLDKAAKTLRVLDFGMDYNLYSNGNGTLVAEYNVKFVNYAGIEAVYYVVDDVINLLRNEDGKYEITKIENGFFNSTGISLFPESLIRPTFGKYVSGPLEQYKVDADGNRIESSTGGYERETFYLFVEIDATTVKVYVGENETEHRAEPLLSATDYTLSYNAGGLAIRIPHEEGSKYSMRLTVESELIIHFTNDFERHGDYSASGTLTLEM